MKPSIGRIRELLTYDPATGLLRWRKSRRYGFAGRVAGNLNDAGYIRVCVDGCSIRAHWIAWAIQTGEWPACEIDHKDRNPSNNKWDNLRLSTGRQNKANSRVKSCNSLGIKGVRKVGKRYAARIRIAGRETHLGMFDTAEEARAAYLEAAKQEHGEFAA